LLPGPEVEETASFTAAIGAQSVSPTGNLIIGVIGLASIALMAATALGNARGRTLSNKELVRVTWGKVLWVLLFSIIMAICVGLGLLLFIIPGLIALTWLIFGYFLIIDKNADAASAISMSRQLARGNAGKIWGVIGASILVAVAAGIATLIPLALFALLGGVASTISILVSGALDAFIQLGLTTLLAMLYLAVSKSPHPAPATPVAAAPTATQG
jgi:hypothetical protein